MNEIDTLPTFEARSFMRWLAKATEKYFEDPENQKRFREWKKERDASLALGEGGSQGAQEAVIGKDNQTGGE